MDRAAVDVCGNGTLVDHADVGRTSPASRCIADLSAVPSDDHGRAVGQGGAREWEPQGIARVVAKNDSSTPSQGLASKETEAPKGTIRLSDLRRTIQHQPVGDGEVGSAVTIPHIHVAIERHAVKGTAVELAGYQLRAVGRCDCSAINGSAVEHPRTTRSIER